MHSLVYCTDSNRNNNILVTCSIVLAGKWNPMRTQALRQFKCVRTQRHEMYAWAAYVSWASNTTTSPSVCVNVASLTPKMTRKKAYSAYKNCLKHALGIQLPVSGIKSNMLKVSDPKITEIFQYFDDLIFQGLKFSFSIFKITIQSVFSLGRIVIWRIFGWMEKLSVNIRVGYLVNKLKWATFTNKNKNTSRSQALK